jgi:hypothetical protein
MTLFPSGVAPVTELLEVERGVTFRCKILLFEDAAKTKPLNITGLTVKLVIEGVTTLASGSGLTINFATGQIAVKLTPVQTAAVEVAQAHYYLTLEENAEEIVPPIKGTMTFTDL